MSRGDISVVVFLDEKSLDDSFEYSNIILYYMHICKDGIFLNKNRRRKMPLDRSYFIATFRAYFF